MHFRNDRGAFESVSRILAAQDIHCAFVLLALAFLYGVCASTRAGGGDQGAASAGVMTFFRPPVRRMEIGMLIIIVRPSRLSFGRPTVPTEMENGGLMSYGVKLEKMIADAASYVDRILRGTNPADLPVQFPTEFELAVNQKGARQLGLQPSPALLARADVLIE